MHVSTGKAKKMFSLSGLLLVPILGTGCSLSPARLAPGYYLIEPTPVGKDGQNKLTVSDAQVVVYADTVKNTLRERMNNARIARTVGGFVQVVTAAVSAMLTGTAGGSVVGAATILSGTSAIIPEVSEIIGAKERAEAFGDGVKAIEIAEAHYLQRVAKMKGGGQISNDKLTPPGAALYESVVASVHLVEARLIGQLPRVEDLQKATSDFSKMDLMPSVVTLKANDKTTIKVSHGGPATAVASDNDMIATVETSDSGYAATITAKRAGDAVITFANGRGGSITVDVTVTQ